MPKFSRTKTLVDRPTHFCPGCLHGITHRLIAEVIDEMNAGGNTIGVFPVGCAVFGYWYLDIDAVSASHGRAPAVATGVKRARPDRLVFSYQGDGDMLAIGTAEAIHAATRGENFTAIFVNNAIYGMTGGQMAPTTMPGQKTQTTPFGRDTAEAGFPLKAVEMFSKIDGVALAQRVSVHDAKHVREAKAAIKNAFEIQMRGEGFSIIEVLSNCPTNWGMTAMDSIKWLEENMLPYYPTGVFKEGSVR
ncbi:MAG: thiamine pyrophosphate-dependent enzyme [Oscillospiraceae bacterium]|nr:thiamine pyrophosphate-dependent enzyme [Oscillospiraceae bacterium]